MTAVQRREEILTALRRMGQPVSATALAARFGVSRQVVVGDIALLRASGTDIAATPRGYILQVPGPEADDQLRFTLACRHDHAGLAHELYLVVDNGGALLDVIVEHPVYGQLQGQLHIFSRYDADCFLKKLDSNDASPLSTLTGGVHLHTVVCRSQEDFLRVRGALHEAEILYEPESNA